MGNSEVEASDQRIFQPSNGILPRICHQGRSPSCSVAGQQSVAASEVAARGVGDQTVAGVVNSLAEKELPVVPEVGLDLAHYEFGVVDGLGSSEASAVFDDVTNAYD